VQWDTSVSPGFIAQDDATAPTFATNDRLDLCRRISLQFADD